MRMDEEKRRLWIGRAAAIAAALLLWHLAARAVGQRLLLVSPADVAVRLGQLVFEKGFMASVLFSLSRIAAGFLLGLSAGVLLAGLSAFFRGAELFL